MIKACRFPYNIVLFTTTLLFFLFSCKNKTKDIHEIVSKSALKEDRAEDVTLLYSEQGRLKVKLSTKEFIRNEYAKPPYAEMRKGLKVEFYNDSLQVESTLTARFARLYEKERNVLIRDSIVVVNKKGEQLKTEELAWNQSLQKFYTEKFVRIRTATQVIYGDGMEANQDFSWYQIKNVKGVLQVEKNEIPAE